METVFCPFRALRLAHGSKLEMIQHAYERAKSETVNTEKLKTIEEAFAVLSDCSLSPYFEVVKSRRVLIRAWSFVRSVISARATVEQKIGESLKCVDMLKSKLEAAYIEQQYKTQLKLYVEKTQLTTVEAYSRLLADFEKCCRDEYGQNPEPETPSPALNMECAEWTSMTLFVTKELELASQWENSKWNILYQDLMAKYHQEMNEKDEELRKANIAIQTSHSYIHQLQKEIRILKEKLEHNVSGSTRDDA